MRRYGIVLGIAALAALAGGDLRLDASTAPRLTAITSTAGARSAVLIEASEPVAYASTRPDPFTVLVDLRNVAAAGYANGFTPQPGSPVRTVVVEPAKADDGAPITRVRVSLSEPVSHHVRSQRNIIFIDFNRDDALQPVTGTLAAPGAPRGPTAAASATSSAVSTSPASVLRAVRAEQEGGSTSVILTGNGKLTAARVEQAGDRRLFLDFPGVSSQMAAVTAIGKDPVERVRVGVNSQDPLVTRVVIDLTHSSAYTVDSASPRELRVVFGEKPAATPAPAPVVAPAPASQPAKPVKAVSTKQPAPAPDAPKAMPAAVPAPVAAAKAAKVDEAKKEEASAPAPAQQPGGSRVIYTAPPSPAGNAARKFEGHPISLDFQGADLRAVLRTFAEISGLNIVIDPAVQGSVDVSLRDVPWDQALDIILRANKLGYNIDGTIVRVAPLNVLADEEKQRRTLNEQQMLAGELQLRTVTLSYAIAEQIKPLLLKSALSSRGTIEVDQRSNTLIISDLQAALDRASSLIASLDRAQPQVEIEARIVVTNKNFKREVGARLGLGGEASPRLGNAVPLTFPNSIVAGGRTGADLAATGSPNAVNLGVLGATSAVGLALGSVNGALNLDVALSALESQGKVTIVSTPRVTTQNNVEAEMTQGTQIPIQVVANNTITVQFKDAALKLLVTPQITAANTVIMRINLENATADFGRSVNGIPPIDTQRAQTTVLMGDGQTTVIGGIYFSSQESREARTPGLHKIPLLGWLFKDNLTNNQNNELLIFITPRILKG